MKVYLIIEPDNEILAAFTTEELAKQYIETKAPDCFYCSIDVFDQILP